MVVILLLWSAIFYAASIPSCSNISWIAMERQSLTVKRSPSGIPAFNRDYLNRLSSLRAEVSALKLNTYFSFSLASILELIRPSLLLSTSSLLCFISRTCSYNSWGILNSYFLPVFAAQVASQYSLGASFTFPCLTSKSANSQFLIVSLLWAVKSTRVRNNP